MMRQQYPKKCYYETLEISPSSSVREITKAYRELARKYHPDSASGTGDHHRFAELSEAYTVLTDAWERTQYDARRRVGTHLAPPTRRTRTTFRPGTRQTPSTRRDSVRIFILKRFFRNCLCYLIGYCGMLLLMDGLSFRPSNPVKVTKIDGKLMAKSVLAATERKYGKKLSPYQFGVELAKKRTPWNNTRQFDIYRKSKNGTLTRIAKKGDPIRKTPRTPIAVSDATPYTYQTQKHESQKNRTSLLRPRNWRQQSRKDRHEALNATVTVTQLGATQTRLNGYLSRRPTIKPSLRYGRFNKEKAANVKA